MTHKIEIEIEAEGMGELMLKKNAIQNIARNSTKDTLTFLSEISSKKGINETLASKKTTIKMALHL